MISFLSLQLRKYIQKINPCENVANFVVFGSYSNNYEFWK